MSESATHAKAKNARLWIAGQTEVADVDMRLIHRALQTFASTGSKSLG
jgi:hypothetical protein